MIYQKICQGDLSEKETEIRQMCGLIEKSLVSTKMTRAQKIELMDYLEQLQLALNILDVKNGVASMNQIQKAGKHLGKKMQSSFSD